MTFGHRHFNPRSFVLLPRSPTPPISPPPPTGTKITSSARCLVEEFQADGPLSGNDIIVIEGMDKRGISLHAPFNCRRTGFVIILTVQDDIRPVGTCRGQFDEWRPARHPNLNRNIALGRVIGHSLSMIPADAAMTPVAVSSSVIVRMRFRRAALLERSCHLQIFQLEKDELPVSRDSVFESSEEIHRSMARCD